MKFRAAEDIVQDTEKGASELFFEAGESIIQLNGEAAEEYAVELVQNRYSMSPLVNLANRTFEAVEEGKHRENIRDYLLEVERSKKRAVKNALDLLSSFTHVGTLSYSSTVIDVLKDIEEVSVLESRPLFEGRKTAEILHGKGVEVDFYPDSAVHDMLLDVDAFLVGSDSLSEEGFTNKTGTSTAAIVCLYLKKPVYVVSDISKVLPKGIPLHFEEQHDPKEVWETDLDVTIHNDYFEKISWIDNITLITGDGIIENKKKIQSERVSENLMKYHPRV
ncbi:MAG: hypothetical protein R6W73_00930 [Candidatus Saliniplasma sp.]